MLAVLSFNAADEVAASSHRHAMIIAMLDGHGGCRLDFLVTLRMATSAVATDLRSTVRKRGGQFWQQHDCSHEVSILTATIGPLGRWRGVWPRSKVSMMIMRPPQCGQACASLSLSAWLPRR